MQVIAKRVSDYPRAAGEFAWLPSDRDATRLLLCCPCGCGDVTTLDVVPDELVQRDGRTWAWDGDRRRPTLTPKIALVGACGWQGSLSDGVFRS